jgi:hypothetical protein
MSIGYDRSDLLAAIPTRDFREHHMGHVVLLGDSIFDNARYVPDRSPVIEQLRKALPTGWSATLLAVDGHITEDVVAQLRGLPSDATHLIVSAGGNDALMQGGLLGERTHSVGEALTLVHEIRERFRKSYRSMLRALGAVGRPTTICTVYDAIPGLKTAESVALAGFNEVILREGGSVGLPIIDLRLICDRSSDYSHVSPIEPSVVGGSKIVSVIAEVVTTHDFEKRHSVIYR